MSIAVIAEVKGLDHGISGRGDTIEEAAEKFREAVVKEIGKTEEMSEQLRELLT